MARMPSSVSSTAPYPMPRLAEKFMPATALLSSMGSQIISTQMSGSAKRIVRMLSVNILAVLPLKTSRRRADLAP